MWQGLPKTFCCGCKCFSLICTLVNCFWLQMQLNAQCGKPTHSHTHTSIHTHVYTYTHTGRQADVPLYTHFVTLRTQIEHKFWLFFPFGKHNGKNRKKIHVEILDTVKNKVPNATKAKTMTENNENKEERQAVNATEATSDKRHTTNDERRTVNGAGTTTNTRCMFHILPIRFQQLSLSACQRCHTRRESVVGETERERAKSARLVAVASAGESKS